MDVPRKTTSWNKGDKDAVSASEEDANPAAQPLDFRIRYLLWLSLLLFLFLNEWLVLGRKHSAVTDTNELK